MNTLLVFDYATTGNDPTRDRPVEFACVRLDMDLNMVGSPTSLHCKPSPDHLPDPAASLMSRITPQLCEQVGLPELRFVNEVHRLLGSPGTISFGYNSIAFDDEVTRFMLWRNLIDPYAREWKNGCGRWDLLELVRATYALRPETLEWPRDDQGNVCFGLEPLTVANGLLHESAHDTLSNVYATIELARLLRDRQPRLYSHVFAMHDKSRALQEMNAKQYVPFVHVGADATTAAGVRLMIPIAPHPTNRNEVIAWDLSKDPRQLLDIDAESIRLRLFTPHERRPEEFEPMPLYAIAANRSPAVFNNLSVLSPARALELGIDTGAALANVPVMLRVLDAWDLPKLLQVVYTRDQVEYDAEQALYDGFLGSHDRLVLDHLRMTDPAELASVKPAFDDPRLDELFLRYKARHYPETLSQRELDKWEEHRYRKLITGYAGSRTVAMVRASVAHWRIKLSEPDEPHDPAKLGILDDVQAYTDRIAAVIDPYEVAVPAPPDTAIMDPARATPSDTIPVQPDLFGDGVVAPPARSVRPRRR
jgi:exodeoxyribonuclease-1